MCCLTARESGKVMCLGTGTGIRGVEQKQEEQNLSRRLPPSCIEEVTILLRRGPGERRGEEGPSWPGQGQDWAQPGGGGRYRARRGL